jgi:transketolase C-terminal domain/subunit
VIFPIAQLTGEQIAIGAAAGLSAMAYAVFILAPAWTSYGRIWERVAASLLTIFILATLLGIGVAIGLAIVWGYTSSQ